MVLLRSESFDLGARGDTFGARWVQGGTEVSGAGVEDVVPVFGCPGVVVGVASGFASVFAGTGVCAFVGGLLADEFFDAGVQYVAGVSSPCGGSVESFPERGQVGAGGVERAGGLLELFVGVLCCADRVLGCVVAGCELVDVGIAGIRWGRSEGRGVGFGEGQLLLKFGDALCELGFGERE